MRTLTERGRGWKKRGNILSNSFRSDSIDTGENFRRRNTTSINEQLSSNIFTYWSRSTQFQQIWGLQLIFSANDFFFRWLHGEEKKKTIDWKKTRGTWKPRRGKFRGNQWQLQEGKSSENIRTLWTKRIHSFWISKRRSSKAPGSATAIHPKSPVSEYSVLNELTECARFFSAIWAHIFDPRFFPPDSNRSQRPTYKSRWSYTHQILREHEESGRVYWKQKEPWYIASWSHEKGNELQLISKCKERKNENQEEGDVPQARRSD